ncbi:hypothetical protein [Terriglobus tenax]|uniref:hypothetical protein n=1 Tax=Terriglobus tenax TaxID=1111115 RepID=UPI0021DFC76A|nr:hypothetical protein [Terriglobus tenax]
MARPPAMKNFRIFLGAIAGSIFAMAGYLVWFFTITKHDPWLPASTGYIVETAFAGILVALVGGLLATLIAANTSAGSAAAAIIFILSAWNIWQTWRQFSTFWAPIVAILVMTPAAYIGGHLPRKHHQ